MRVTEAQRPRANGRSNRAVGQRPPAAAGGPRPAPAPRLPPALLFNGANTSATSRLLQAAPGAITEAPDPAGSGEPVLQMTVDDGDVAPSPRPTTPARRRSRRT